MAISLVSRAECILIGRLVKSDWVQLREKPGKRGQEDSWSPASQEQFFSKSASINGRAQLKLRM